MIWTGHAIRVRSIGGAIGRRRVARRVSECRGSGEMRVLSVDGPFNSRVLVDMSADEAGRLLEDEEALSSLAPSIVTEGVERDIASIARDDEALSLSALAGSARVLAWQMENPYVSATAKSMCSKELRETLERLRAMAPAKP